MTSRNAPSGATRHMPMGASSNAVRNSSATGSRSSPIHRAAVGITSAMPEAVPPRGRLHGPRQASGRRQTLARSRLRRISGQRGLRPGKIPDGPRKRPTTSRAPRAGRRRRSPRRRSATCTRTDRRRRARGRRPCPPRASRRAPRAPRIRAASIVIAASASSKPSPLAAAIGGLEEHDARLRHVALVAALERDRDAGRLAASAAVSKVRFSVSPHERYIVGWMITGTPAALIWSSTRYASAAPSSTSSIRTPSRAAARAGCPARAAR